jgi:signal transduction histidine kinase
LKLSEEQEQPFGCLASADGASWERDRVVIFVHDLRNLLSALALNAEVLLSPTKEATEAIATNMLSAIRRMDQLVSSLLDLGRVRGGEVERGAGEPRDAAELVREAVDIFRPLASRRLPYRRESTMTVSSRSFPIFWPTPSNTAPGTAGSP